MHKLEMAHKQRYEEVTADADYESPENYLYLEANGQMCFIKPANYNAQKTKKYRSQIGRILNNRKEKCADRIAVSCTGLQPQKAVDETAKRRLETHYSEKKAA